MEQDVKSYQDSILAGEEACNLLHDFDVQVFGNQTLRLNSSTQILESLSSEMVIERRLIIVPAH